jgi:UrcA family protein
MAPCRKHAALTHTITEVTNMPNRLIPALALAALSATPVYAAGTSDEMLYRTRIVNYADLDLARATGAKTLYARLTEAARRVCEPDTFGAHPTVGTPNCSDDALATAVATVNAPTLTELFQQKRSTGRRLGSM